MRKGIAGVSIAMLGGDRRELELAKTLLQLDVDLRLVGFPSHSDLVSAKFFSDPIAAVAAAKVVLAPMSNTDMEGRIVSRLDGGPPIDLTQVLPRLDKGTIVLIGVAKPIIRTLVNKHELKLVETAEVDEIAILNSIPTAEGAIQLAMEEVPYTIHGSRCLVLGFGRCGKTLALALSHLGAQVTVADRSRVQLAWADAFGLKPLPLADLINHVDFDIIFNTIPALILTEVYLSKLDPSVLIIDLAAAPGGVDFAAANQLGIRAIHALSLPGKVAPLTAGKILSDCIPRLLEEMLGGTGNAI